MPEISTLEYIADLVIRRTVAEVGLGTDLVSALERAYPFSDDNDSRSAWTEALRRHGIAAARVTARWSPVGGPRQLSRDPIV
jgi:hypothetical protein